MDVENRSESGTVFSLYFPRTSVQVPAREQEAPVRSVNAKILVVDDEPIQLRTASRILTRLGYEVTTLGSGVQAYECFARAAASVGSTESPFDLVIVDMLLNECWDGLGVLEQIERLFPDQKSMITSGHAPNERGRLAAQRGIPWLAKPYTAQALAKMVAEALRYGS